MLEICAREKLAFLLERTRAHDLASAGPKKRGDVAAPMTEPRQWIGRTYRTTYYEPTKFSAKINADLIVPIKKMIETIVRLPHRGCVAWHEQEHVQRILQLKGWQVRKRPRIKAKASRVEGQDPGYATDLCRVWGSNNGAG